MASAEMPGAVIKRELEGRGWTQTDLAFILGRQQSDISDLILGKRTISPEIANELSIALGHDAHYWLSLEAAYHASKITPNDERISRRRKLYERYPIREMLKRGWVEPTDDIDLLEERVCHFLAIQSIDETPQTHHAALKSTAYSDVTPAQAAWIVRVRQLARYTHALKFSSKSCDAVLERFKLFLKDPEEARHVPHLLAEAGIRFVIVEAFPSTRIDGVCIWLDRQSPVIGLSMRFDRLNAFWHPLLHEIDHVKHREGLEEPILDLDLISEDQSPHGELPDSERRANAFAEDFVIKRSDLDNFVARIRPLYSKQKIQLFAARMQVHPGLVVGQLHRRGEIPYSHHRESLVKVRYLLTDIALTDGWGYKPTIH
jgi:HTH-type transcriptional regulator/antitoxin HigA